MEEESTAVKVVTQTIASRFLRFRQVYSSNKGTKLPVRDNQVDSGHKQCPVP